MSYNVEKDVIETDKVKSIWKTGIKDVVKINGEILCTIDHKFLTISVTKKEKDVSYKRLKDIDIYDAIFKLKGKKIKPVQIEVIEYWGELTTYDLKTEKNHNYFCNGYLVHNSTSITFLQVMKRIAYMIEKYIMIVTEALHPQGVMLIESIRNELIYNDKFKKAYMLELVKDTEEEVIVRRGNDWILIQARGADQRIRSAKFRDSRITLAICDDIEGDDVIYSREVRERIKRMFFGKLMPALDKNGKIWVIGTVLHEEGLLNLLLQTPTWIRKRYSLFEERNGEYVSLWKERYSVKDILEIKKEYEQQGLLDLFYSEYMNIPINPEDTPFNREDIRYYKTPPSNLKKVILTDLAISEKKYAHFSVVMAVGIDDTGRVFVLEYKAGKMLPNELIDTIFNYADKWDIRDIGIETVAFQRALKYWLMDEMRQRRMWLNIIELKTGKDKGAKARRIMMLQPLLKSNSLYITTNMRDLEITLSTWQPNKSSGRDDIVDTLAYVVQFIGNYGKVGLRRRKPLYVSQYRPLDAVAGY